MLITCVSFQPADRTIVRRSISDSAEASPRAFDPNKITRTSSSWNRCSTLRLNSLRVGCFRDRDHSCLCAYGVERRVFARSGQDLRHLTSVDGRLYSAVDTVQPNRRKYEEAVVWRVFPKTIRLNCASEGPGVESQLAHDSRPIKNFQKSFHPGCRDRNDDEQRMSVLNWSAEQRCVSSGGLTVWRTWATFCRSRHIMRRMSWELKRPVMEI